MKKITILFIACSILTVWCLGDSTPALAKDPPSASSFDKESGLTTTSTGGNPDGSHTVTQTDASGNPVGQTPAGPQTPPTPTPDWTDNFEEWGDDDLDDAGEEGGGASTPDSGPDTAPTTPPTPPADAGDDDGGVGWTDDFEEWGDDDPVPEIEDPSYEDQVQDRIDRNREWDLRRWGMRDEVRRAREQNKKNREKRKGGGKCR
ncbi:hypothetical protein ACFL4E_02275 [Candidatus Omnitrophota bacterium]